MTKREILSLDLKQYNNTEECPYFGYENLFLSKKCLFKCGYTFYCIDNDNCQFDKDPNSRFFEFIDNEGNIQRYIKDFQDYNCTVNSDCLSNNCQYNICYSGNGFFTECSDNYFVNKFKEFQQEMKCGKLDGNECSDSSECAGICSNICESYAFYSVDDEVKSNESFSFAYLISGIIAISFWLFVSTGGLFCCFCFCLCCKPCRENKKNKESYSFF